MIPASSNPSKSLMGSDHGIPVGPTTIPLSNEQRITRVYALQLPKQSSTCDRLRASAKRRGLELWSQTNKDLSSKGEWEEMRGKYSKLFQDWDIF